MPGGAGFLFAFKARQQAHSGLCNGWRNAEGAQKDQQDGIFFDKNRLRQEAESLLSGSLVGVRGFIARANHRHGESRLVLDAERIETLDNVRI